VSCSGEKFFDRRMPQFRILLINTHVPRSTKQLVEGVQQKHTLVWWNVCTMLTTVQFI